MKRTKLTTSGGADKFPTPGLHSTLHHSTPRSWNEPRLNSNQLIYPLFLSNKDNDHDVDGFPLVKQWGKRNGYSSLVKRCNELVEKGLTCVMLFGVVDSKEKDGNGIAADGERNPVIMGVKALRESCSSLFVAVDVCLCEYTSHGHCGLIKKVEGEEDVVIDNEATCLRLGKIAVEYARAGAHMVCPSDMMDNRVGVIREELNLAGFQHVSIMSYTSKKASMFYAPFRAAVESTFKGHRKRYQHPVGASGIAMRALQRDLDQGADVVIVKPALFCGDIIQSFAQTSNVPVAVYIVSGEAVMLRAYGERIGDMASVIRESHISMLRAGATILITYFAPEILDMLLAKTF